MDFKEYWKNQNTDSFTFEKAEALSDAELSEVRSLIKEKTKKGWPSSKIIKQLQEQFHKLGSTYRAESAYWTEVKKRDTELVARAGEELDIDTYKAILSPNACELCRKKTDNGKKIFTQSDVSKTEYGATIPFHPGCYCILVPHIE